MIKELSVTVDTVKHTRNPVYTFSTSDWQSLKFIVTVQNDEAIVDLTGLIPRIAIKKPDKTTVLQDGVVTDGLNGKCEFTLTSQAYVVGGIYKAEVMLYQGTEKVATTSGFSYTVSIGVMNIDLESSNDWPTLSKAIEAGENEPARISAEENRITAETTRIQNETTREANELTRQTNTATAINNAVQATANANSAAQSANTAATNAETRLTELNGVDTVQLHDRVSSVESSVAQLATQGGESFTVNLAKYGITATTTDLTATTANYNIAYANGVGFQNAINDAKAKGIKDITIPSGNYPLCYATNDNTVSKPIINASGINISAYGCKFYVIYDDLNTGLNPYYTGDPTLAHSMCGIVFVTDSDIRGAEIVGERGLRTHANTKYREFSYGIALNNYTNGNVIKDCRIHHFSGDGIGLYKAMDQVAWWQPTFTSVTWNNTAFVASNYAYTSPRQSIATLADVKKPMQLRSSSYFIYTTAPLKLHCFNQSEQFIGTVRVRQGEPFFFLEGSYYWYLEVTRNVYHDTTATESIHFALGYGYYHGTTIDSCEIYLNQRGGISNVPSSTKIMNCDIHHNGGAYGNMVAFYDGTQFGVDIEDWFIHSITIENSLIYGNLHGVLYRCHSISFIDSIIYGYVDSLNYGIDFYAKGTVFKGTCTMAHPTDFGNKTAINCTFDSTFAREIEVISNALMPVSTSFDDSIGLASFYGKDGRELFTLDLSYFDPSKITPYISSGLLVYADFTGKESPSAVTFTDTTGKASITTAAGACTSEGLAMVTAFTNMANVTWNAAQTFNQEISVEMFCKGYPNYLLFNSDYKSLINTIAAAGYDPSGITNPNGNETISDLGSTVPYKNTSAETVNVSTYAGLSVYNDDGIGKTASQNGIPGIGVIKYQHIVAIYKADGTIQIYINGYPFITNPTTTNFSSWDFSTFANTFSVFRGQANSKQVLKCFRIYNRALTKAEIRKNRDYQIKQYGIIV